MRASLEKRLNDIWYGGQPPPFWLRMLVPVYSLFAFLDRWRKLRSRQDGLEAACIVVVGNLTVGGSGKTPLVIRLCRIFKEAGLKPGVVSRGYGRNTSEMRLVSPGSSPSDVGDEPLLIVRSTGLPVVVAQNRPAAALALLKKGCNVIVSDDGLQHYRLPRDIEICVVDGGRGFGNGLRLPAGPLRESQRRLNAVDHVVINGSMLHPPQDIEAQRMELAPGLLRSLNDNETWRLPQYAGCKVNAVAGIGNPERFFDSLQHARIKVVEHRFPDHHSYQRDDFSGMQPDLPIIMTEKDAVKCTDLGLRNAWYLSIEAVLPADWEARLIQQVHARLGSRT